MTKRTHRQTTNRTTTSRRGTSQQWVRGGSRDERIATSRRVADNLIFSDTVSNTSGGSRGSAAAQVFIDTAGERYAPTTSPRPRSRPDVGVNRAMRRTRRK